MVTYMCKVSVVINCYNGEKFLKDTLNSLSAQTYNNYEVIFIDNCSTDNTSIIANSFDKRLKYFKTPYNMPLGKARNFALERCNGEYIAFLDSDDLWDNNKLLLQVKIMDENPKCVISITNNYEFNMLLDKKYVVIKDIKTGIIKYTRFATNYKFGLSSIMIRSSSLINMPMNFDERLSYAEEFDLFLRLATNGDIYFYNEPLSTYRIHGDMHSIKLKESIPQEYEWTIENLKEYVPDYVKNNKKIVKRISFLRDYTSTKLSIEKGEFKKARKLIKRYFFYSKKAAYFYCLLLLPSSIVKKIYKKRFQNKNL